MSSSSPIPNPARRDDNSADKTLTHVPNSSVQNLSARKVSSDSEKTVISDRSPDSPSAGSGASPMYRVAWQVAAEALPGEQLDHFRIDSLVGIGGMGAVFRGEDLRLNREVAIKAIPAAGRDPESMRRFRFEAQSAAKLDHPNIARVYYVGETPNWSYIVFEFVEGVNLRELIVRQGPMSVEQSVYLIRQVAQALQHASDRQVVHRDIKPSNIVLTPSGQAKIVDMGLARGTEMDRSTNDLTASGVTLGTFDYISPEQAHDPREADVRSDLYSLGCTWYYLLTGLPPFPEGTALQKLLLHGTKMPEDPRVHRSDLSDSLIAILRKLIAKKPRDRYQQPVDLIDDLQTLAIMEDLSWTRDSDPREQAVPASNSWLRTALPYFVSVGFIAAIAIWLQSEGVRDSRFLIPSVNFPTPTRTVGAPSTTAKQSEPSGALLSVPAEPGSIVVDSRFTQEQLETNRQLASSLDQAVERINVTPDANRIVIQSPTIQATSNLRSLNRNFGHLTIESSSGIRAKIEVDVSDTEIADTRAWLDCGASQITITGCDIVWRAHHVRQSLFLCRNGSRLNLSNCTISITPSGPVALTAQTPSVIRCESSTTSVGTNEPSSLVNSVLLDCQGLVMTGFADAIQVVPPIRTECVIEDSLFALSGSLIQIPRVNTSNRRNSRVVLDMERVTSWTSRSFINAAWVSGNAPPIPVTRTARQCIFSGMESLVLWDAAANEDWKFWEESNQREGLSQWLDFRGRDNCYDVEITKQIVEAKLRNGMAESLPFNAEARLLSDERGIENVIPWKRRPSPEEAVNSALDLSRFELVESHFPRGADIQKLKTARSYAIPSQSVGTVSGQSGAASNPPGALSSR